MKRVYLLSIILVFILNACSVNNAEVGATLTLEPTDISGTQTVVAASIFSSQTAKITPATVAPTRTPWPTSTGRPTPGPTHTPEDSPTPTGTLNNSEIPNRILCFQAAVSVYADWEAYQKIIGNSKSFSEEVGDELNRFLNERKNRVVQYVDTGFGPSDELLIKGVNLLKEFSCVDYAGELYATSWFMDNENPWGVGFSNRKSLIYQFYLRKDINDIRSGLIDVYHVAEEDLAAIEDPIWENVVTRYEVEISE